MRTDTVTGCLDKERTLPARENDVLVTQTLAGQDMSLCDGWQFGHLTTGHLLPLTCFCGVFWEISFPAASKRLPSTFRKCDFD